MIENELDITDPYTWCTHKYISKKGNRPPRLNCKGCWFRFFHDRPGIVLGIISVINTINGLYDNGSTDMESINAVKKILKQGMGNKWVKNFDKYYNEIYLPLNKK